MIDVEAEQKAYAADCWIETPAGKMYFADPKIDMRAAAHSLAQVNRYNGHGRYPWSVASHSVLVSLLMEEVTGGSPYEGLWHDKTEYVMADLASPVKPLVPDWRALDQRLDGSFSVQMGLPLVKSDECHKADMLALFIEAYQLMPSKGEGWHDPQGFRPWALKLRQQGWKISEIDWRHSRSIFAARHNEVKPVHVSRVEF